MDRRIVFIMSSENSGSTWVGYVLGSHPESAFLGEYSRAWGLGTTVPCTLCAARGRPDCEVLHGIDQVPPDQAFDFAFSRTGKPVLVDNSKIQEWTELFAGQPEAIRLVHVVKDPRNWLCSRRRRGSESAGQLLPLWVDANTRIGEFCRRLGAPTATVFYDELVADQPAGFAALFAFCGLPYEASALEYWTVGHHGFAANGASSALVGEGRAGPPPAHFATADPAFYAARDRTLFADERWKRELSATDRQAVEADPRVAALLAGLGRRLVADGLALVNPPGPAARLRRAVAAGLSRLRLAAPRA